MNPPFHQGRKGEPELGQSFILAAKAMVKKTGNLWMVANRHLAYENILRENFSDVAEIGGDARYKLIHANLAKK